MRMCQGGKNASSALELTEQSQGSTPLKSCDPLLDSLLSSNLRRLVREEVRYQGYNFSK